MLFHSFEFVFAFLPLCLLGFLLVHRFFGWESALVWLAGASVVFYGQWSLAHAFLLTASIIANLGYRSRQIISFKSGVFQKLLRRFDADGM